MVNKFVKSSVVLAIAAGMGMSASAQTTDVKSNYDLCWQDSSGQYVKSSGNEVLNCGKKAVVEAAPVLKVIPAVVAPVVVAPVVKEKPVSIAKLSADTLFNLGKHTLKPEGVRLVSEVGQKLASRSVKYIHVTGQADRLGSAQSNLALSQRRADTVKAYLVKEGVPSEKICTVGLGETESDKSTECRNLGKESAKNARLVECLAQFRRVDIDESDEACPQQEVRTHSAAPVKSYKKAKKTKQVVKYKTTTKAKKAVKRKAK